jgi:RNA polymerase sigma-70 factor (ECF subfamily)
MDPVDDRATLSPPSPVPLAEGVDLARVRARDPEALAAFFEAYFDRVYGLVFRLVGDRAQAEDVTGDVFLKVHRAIDRLDPGKDPMPWLATIAANACRDLWRSGAERMRRAAVPVDDPLVRERLTDGANQPEHEAIAHEREQAVRAAIDGLPDDLRESVLLYDYAGLSHEAIAAALGITHDAARKRHSRALTALGRALGDRLR